MRDAAAEATRAGVPRPAYSFAPRDVAEICVDDSARVYFRLQDGRIFSDQGEPEGRLFLQGLAGMS